MYHCIGLVSNFCGERIFFPWYSDFLNFGELVNYTKYREQQWRGWHFVCICISWTWIFASLRGKSSFFYWCQVFAVSFWFLSKKWCSSISCKVFHNYNNRFVVNVTKFCSKLQIVDNPFTLHPKSITVLVCCQIHVVKGCFFS